MTDYNERMLRQDYWDLWHMVKKTSKKNMLRHIYVRWLDRTKRAMVAAGIDPGPDEFNDGNRGPVVKFIP